MTETPPRPLFVMSRKPILVAMVGVAVINGQFSPTLVALAHAGLAPLMPMLAGSAAVLLFLAISVVTAGTIMIAGVPAALFERFTNRKDTDILSALVWLAATIVLSLPALGAAIARFTGGAAG